MCPASRPGNVKGRPCCIIGLTSSIPLLKNNVMITKINAIMVIIINASFHTLCMFHLW